MTLNKEKYLLHTSLTILGFCLSILVLKLSSSYLTLPYGWISLIWICITLYISLSSHSSGVKVIFFNAFLIILFFGIFEVSFWQMRNADTGSSRRLVHTNSNKNTDKFVMEHSVLGYAPVKDNEVFVTKDWKNKPTLNFKYTITSSGLRRSNNNDNLDYKESIVFFGCSYTFGESVNDEETIPFQVGVLSSNKYKVYNFGFSGYGTHQMLSSIENRLVERVVDVNIKYAIYQALPDHINRLLGWRKWDVHGPKYVLDEDKTIKNIGHFDDYKFPIFKTIVGQFEKSNFYRKMTERKTISANHIELFASIVSTARNTLSKLYSDIEFHVIFWDIGPWIVPKDLPKKIVQSLKNNKINIHLISDILPNYNERAYLINEYDSHTNPLANKIIAEYIAKQIIK